LGLIGQRTRVGEESLREVKPLGQLGDFGAEGGKLFEDLGGKRVIAAGLLRVPAGDQTTVDVSEGATRYQDKVVEIP
jgi:hypothetical protein